jgi:hypothetical protein
MLDSIAHQVVKNTLVNFPVSPHILAQLYLLQSAVAVFIRVMTNVDDCLHLVGLEAALMGK